MDMDLLELLSFGALAIVAGLFVLINMVRDISTQERQRWLLGVGLGTGIIAFGLKLGLVVLFSQLPLNVAQSSIPVVFPSITPNLGGQMVYEQSISQQPYIWQALPTSAPFPANNPPTKPKVQLGEKLFKDKRLSKDDSVACVSCHQLSRQMGGATVE